MQSIGDYAAHIKRQKRAVHAAHRRAFGAQRPTTPEQRAQYVAESILLHEAEGRGWTWAQYGLARNWEQQTLVTEAIERLW